MTKSVNCEIIGHILIIKDDINYEAIYEFAKQKLKQYPSIKTVAKQKTKVTGWERVRELEYVLGENNFETMYKEHGCVFKLNPSKVFFSPRLSGERFRIAQLVSTGEKILNFFAGVGPFSIIIAKNNPSVVVHSIELNKTAYNYMVENIALNKCQGSVIPYLGDAFEIVPKHFKNSVNRVLLPLPAVADRALPIAITTLKGGQGVIHWQITLKLLKGADERSIILKKTDHLIRTYSEEIEYKINKIRFIRSLAPRVSHFAVDIEIL